MLEHSSPVTILMLAHTSRLVLVRFWLFFSFTFFLLSRKLDYLDFVSLDSCRNMSLMMLEIRGWWRFDETSLWSSNPQHFLSCHLPLSCLLKMSPKLVGFLKKAVSCNTFESKIKSEIKIEIIQGYLHKRWVRSFGQKVLDLSIM